MWASSQNMRPTLGAIDVNGQINASLAAHVHFEDSISRVAHLLDLFAVSKYGKFVCTMKKDRSSHLTGLYSRCISMNTHCVSHKTCLARTNEQMSLSARVLDEYPVRHESTRTVQARQQKRELNSP